MIEAVAIRDDRLDGAEAIASYLGWTARRVTYMREKNTSCPIRKLPGLGLYAFKSELEAWLRHPDSLRKHA
jgi:hypothetical protein